MRASARSTGNFGVYATTSSCVAAVMPYYGTTDVTALPTRDSGGTGLTSDDLAGYLGVSPTADPDLVALASPVYHASPDDPPVFVFQGTLDAYLSLSQPESLVEALVSAGVHTQLHLVQGAGHGGRTGFYGAAARAVRNFLDVYVRGE